MLLSEVQRNWRWVYLNLMSILRLTYLFVTKISTNFQIFNHFSPIFHIKKYFIVFFLLELLETFVKNRKLISSYAQIFVARYLHRWLHCWVHDASWDVLSTNNEKKSTSGIQKTSLIPCDLVQDKCLEPCFPNWPNAYQPAYRISPTSHNPNFSGRFQRSTQIS